MGLAALHAFARHGPNAVGDFGRPGHQHFAGPRSAKNAKLKRTRARAVFLPEHGHERRQCVVRHRGVMLDLADLRLLGKELVEIAAPARRVLAGAITAHPRPIKYALNAPTDAPR